MKAGRSAHHIGLTGGIGSGKTTFGLLLQRHGAVIIDSDQIARRVTGPHGDAMAAIAQAFGCEYVDGTGALDRALMRHRAYTDPQARSALEAIVHPLVSQHSKQQAEKAEASGARAIVFDIPLLVESGRWTQRLDAIMVVDCPEHLQIQRVMARNGLERATVESILAAQAPRNVRRAAADVVVNNGDNCSLADLEQLATETAALFGL